MKCTLSCKPLGLDGHLSEYNNLTYGMSFYGTTYVIVPHCTDKNNQQ